MIKNQLNLFVEINKYEFVFAVTHLKENNNFGLIHSTKVPLEGINNSNIVDLNLVNKIIKKNIYEIERKLDYIFKEAIIIINNFSSFSISCSGFKKLNGSQLGKENITYILNSLKSKITDTEENKTILHIFNTKYILDFKEIENLPIGLFGNFYSHELSFLLIGKNDHKNLINIFEKCNLRIKRIFSKNFLEGIHIINQNTGLENFFKIEINDDNIEIFLFENSALKFVQHFEFGNDIVLKDISKIIGLNKEIVKDILINSNFSESSIETETIEKKFFENINFRKIKKKLIYDIAKSRIQEIAEIVIFKNINISSLIKKNSTIFLRVQDISYLKCFEKIFLDTFSSNRKFEFTFLKTFPLNEIYESANKLVQYGWKKEAVPVINEKKSIITRLFDLIFR